jgi:hypothetical protein
MFFNAGLRQHWRFVLDDQGCCHKSPGGDFSLVMIGRVGEIGAADFA